jgi:hypothetical protein
MRRLLVMAALLASACGTVDLPAPQMLRSNTTITNESGVPLGNDPLFATGPTTGAGWKLRPGDVIHLQRWAPGPRQPTSRTTPVRVVDRIPLRKVNANDSLFDYEQEFLSNLLITNRTATFSANARAAMATEVHSAEATMWNALVDNLRVKRITVNGATALILTIDLAVVVASLPEQIRLLFARRPVEISGFTKSYSSPYLAVFDIPTPSKNPDYYPETIVGAIQPLYNFLSIDLGGVDFRNPGPEESHWSLADVVASGICTADAPDATIIGFRAPGAWRTVWADGTSPTHRFVRITTDAIRARRLTREILPPFLKTTVKRSILDELAVRDVDGLIWSTTNTPAHCRR